MDEPHPHMQVTFPFDSNIRYLPLVYLIPEDQIVRYPTLNALPRCLSEIAASEPMMDLLDSDAFLKDIMDATAALAFPHFGFGGWKEHYTGYCPVWRLSYALPLWASLWLWRVERTLHWLLSSLAALLCATTLGQLNRSGMWLGIAAFISHEAWNTNSAPRRRSGKRIICPCGEACDYGAGVATNFGHRARNALR